MKKEKVNRINKYEIYALYVKTLKSELIAVTGVSHDKLMRNMFGFAPKGKSKDDLLLTDAENDRLRFVQEMVHHLRAQYDAKGIQGWFLRHRLELDGKRPLDILKGEEWQPGHAMPQKALKLAEAVGGPYRGT